MAYENTAGLNVTNQYGPRNTGGSVGTERSTGSIQSISVNLTGEMLNSGYVAPTYMPKGAMVIKAMLRVDEVFVVSTSGTVAVGGTAPGTNGIILTEAKLEALGTSNVTSLLAGTWDDAHATGPLATEKVTTAITGTVGATSGKATLYIEFYRKTKV
jgi:hypothetical protein